MEERNAQRVAGWDGSDSLLPVRGTGGRFHNIDLIEALAMLFVVIYHTQVYDSNIMPEGGEASSSVYVNYMLRGILSTCVPLFFFANGFLLFNRPLDLKKTSEKNRSIRSSYYHMGRHSLRSWRITHRFSAKSYHVREDGVGWAGHSGDQSPLVYGRTDMPLRVFPAFESGI